MSKQEKEINIDDLNFNKQPHEIYDILIQKIIRELINDDCSTDRIKEIHLNIELYDYIIFKLWNNQTCPKSILSVLKDNLLCDNIIRDKTLNNDKIKIIYNDYIPDIE